MMQEADEEFISSEERTIISVGLLKKGFREFSCDFAGSLVKNE